MTERESEIDLKSSVFPPFSPILPAPVGEPELDEAVREMRWHLRGHYVVGGLPAPDASEETWEAAGRWARARFEATVAACPECREKGYTVKSIEEEP